MVYMHKKTTMNRKMSDTKQQQQKRIADDLRSIYIVDGSYVINRLPPYSCLCLSVRCVRVCGYALLLFEDWEPVKVPTAATAATDIYFCRQFRLFKIPNSHRNYSLLNEIQMKKSHYYSSHVQIVRNDSNVFSRVREKRVDKQIWASVVKFIPMAWNKSLKPHTQTN